MRYRALACGAVIGLCEAARAVLGLPHVAVATGLAVAAASVVAYAVASFAVALALAPLLAARARDESAAPEAAAERADRRSMAAASAIALGVLVAALRLRFLVGFGQPALLPAAPSHLVEGAVAGLVAYGLLRRVRAPLLRRAWLAAAAAGLVVAAGTGWAKSDTVRRAAPARVRPSVLLVSVDTLRDDRVGCCAGGVRLTPNLDLLAAGGTRFTRAVAPVALTGPSHVTMLTGLYPVRHGARRNGVRMNDEVETIVETLSRAGYRTGGFVSAWPLADIASGLARHFDHYDEDFSPYSWLPFDTERVPLLWLVDRTAMFVSYRAVNTVPGTRFFGEYAERGGARTTARAIDWIGRQAGRPFFAFVHLYEPHTPYAPPLEHIRAVDPGYSGTLHRFEARWMPDREERFRDPAMLARISALYDAEVAHADALVGELLGGLARLGRADDTVVVFTADHGESLAEHGNYFAHGKYLYEPTLRVPLLVRHPGGRFAGQRIDDLVKLADIAPTLLEIAGVASRAPFDGRSLVPLLSGERLGEERLARGSVSVGSEMQLARHYVRTRRYKLIWMVDLRTPRTGIPFYEELYDLELDPGELDNLLLAGATPPAVVDELRLEMRAWVAADRGRDAPLDPEVERRLRALGYL